MELHDDLLRAIRALLALLDLQAARHLGNAAHGSRQLARPLHVALVIDEARQLYAAVEGLDADGTRARRHVLDQCRLDLGGGHAVLKHPTRLAAALAALR